MGRFMAFLAPLSVRPSLRPLRRAPVGRWLAPLARTVESRTVRQGGFLSIACGCGLGKRVLRDAGSTCSWGLERLPTKSRCNRLSRRGCW